MGKRAARTSFIGGGLLTGRRSVILIWPMDHTCPNHRYTMIVISNTDERQCYFRYEFVALCPCDKWQHEICINSPIPPCRFLVSGVDEHANLRRITVPVVVRSASRRHKIIRSILLLLDLVRRSIFTHREVWRWVLGGDTAVPCGLHARLCHAFLVANRRTTNTVGMLTMLYSVDIAINIVCNVM